MVLQSEAKRRTFVLDTNILIHDPNAVHNFEEHDVVIPLPVLEELDRMKAEASDRGRQARQAIRHLSTLVEHHGVASSDSVHIPLALSSETDTGKGNLYFWRMPAEANHNPANASKDDEILFITLFYSKKIDHDVTLITNDINLRVKSSAYGVNTQEYRNDTVFNDKDSMVSGSWVADENSDFWSMFEETHAGVTVEIDGESYQGLYAFKGGPTQHWFPGIRVADSTSEFEGRVIDIVGDYSYVRPLQDYRNSQAPWGVRAKDDLQNFAMNLLLDPDIDLVTLAGVAGTGKTFIAMAVALKLAFDDRLYEKIVITRETVPMGEAIGFMPGTEEEKLSSWLQGFWDNIEQLVEMEGGASGAATRDFIERRLQMRSIGMMRGRTFTDTLLIIDEAQNLSPKQIKNLVTRAGKNTKVICLGNVDQIDTPYISHPGSTGLANLVHNFRDWPHAGHVTLEGVERSRLAAAAERLL